MNLCKRACLYSIRKKGKTLTLLAFLLVMATLMPVSYTHLDVYKRQVWGRVVGDGDIDWRLFFQLYHKYAEGKPFILEYVNEENFREIMRRVNEYDA